MKKLELISYKSKRPKIIDKHLVFDLEKLTLSDTSFLVVSIGPGWDAIILDGRHQGHGHGYGLDDLKNFIRDKHNELTFLDKHNGICDNLQVRNILLELNSRVYKLEKANDSLQNRLDDIVSSLRHL